MLYPEAKEDEEQGGNEYEFRNDTQEKSFARGWGTDHTQFHRIMSVQYGFSCHRGPVH